MDSERRFVDRACLRGLLVRLLGDGTKNGISRQLTPALGAAEVRDQAHLVLQDALEAGIPSCRYGDGTSGHAFSSQPGRIPADRGACPGAMTGP